MRVPVCHHFWENGRHARWAPQKFPVPEIEAAVKGDYLYLQQRRPPSKRYGAYTVLFDYRPARDVFGREIVPISFAFLPDESLVLAPLAQKELAKCGRQDLFISLEEPGPPARRKSRAPIWMGLGAALLALALWLLL